MLKFRLPGFGIRGFCKKSNQGTSWIPYLGVYIGVRQVLETTICIYRSRKKEKLVTGIGIDMYV